jgi:hypothetical protein
MAQSIAKRGSVVLIRYLYLFTDLTGAKVRPALVLTPDHLLPRLEGVLCLFISSEVGLRHFRLLRGATGGQQKGAYPGREEARQPLDRPPFVDACVAHGALLC